MHGRRDGWCERGELNPHGYPLDPKSSASASSATLATPVRYEAANKATAMRQGEVGPAYRTVRRDPFDEASTVSI